ncbi:MAG: ribbon-helix-helix domain-containing protein [Oscillospiraceae bacterium]|nr:ribbon-helix-helix domain-containing protein [Oscillospiraceae bacterium]
MKKTLYSLMLSDDVVRAVDEMAHRLGTNRSALVNQILAEYVDMETPERQIQDIFRQIGELLVSDRELVPFVTPNANSISVKSSLQYRYRPTVKYSVELYRNWESALGELSVVFRTQSQELLDAMADFFRLWKQVEDELIAPYRRQPVEYALYAGRFTRTIALAAGRNYTTGDIAGAISAYVRLFDRLMKGYLARTMTGQEVYNEYLCWLRDGNTII